MGLGEYRRKRDFTHAPEPRGQAPPPKVGRLRMFVVQKHAASRLHYDVRLELEGVLKSWAVPKGPSLDPADQRLAMEVEDHPIECCDFEGIIPPGEYGGGTVLVWDRGTWEPLGNPHRAYRAGKLDFVLHGEKLRGGWRLVKKNGGGPSRDDGRRWLLIKQPDGEARAGRDPITGIRPESVSTGRSIEQIAADADRVWHSHRGGAEAAAVRGAGRPDSASPAPQPISADDVPGVRRAALPRFVMPQLATLVARAPIGDAWFHEMKFDGYRILARLDHGRVALMSRNGRDWTDQFPPVRDAVARLPVEQAMIDGEVAVLLPDGTTSFQALQNVLSGASDGQLAYMAFDLLHLDGRDLADARLEDRKRLLAGVLDRTGGSGGTLRYSDHVIGNGPEFVEHACRLGLEGVVSKRRDAPYRGTRGADWLKIKCLKQQEVVIGGYTDPEGSRIGLGALLAGVYEGDRLVYVGKVGTGFSNQGLRTLKRRLSTLARDSSPFATRPSGVPRAHWVDPELVAQVTFTEWTSDGKMRHPSFQGLREDKPAQSVVRELPSTPGTPAAAGKPAEPRRPARKPPARWGAAKQPDAGTATVAGVRLTHPDRVIYPVQQATKRDLARFYESIADWILPHLQDRPTTLVRCPEGAQKDCFYQKHVGYWAPETVRRVKIQEKRKVGEYLVVDSLPALVGLVQIGILEIHTWNSVVEHLERPDRIVLDLDPGSGVEWTRVVDAARLVRARLEEVGLESFVKTTGGKGLHVVVPLDPPTTWDDGSAFARALAERMARDEPRAYIARMAKGERRGKIFVDYLRNVRGSTSVAAYSTRAYPQAPVSVPLAWDELSPRTRSDHYTIANVPRRLAGLNADPWARYWTTRQALPSPRSLDSGMRGASRT